MTSILLRRPALLAWFSAAVMATTLTWMAPTAPASASGYSSQQWNLNASIAAPDGSNYGVRADLAWPASTGTGAVVGVVDLGIVEHADLEGKVLPGYDFVTDLDSARDGDGWDADPSDPGNYWDGQSSTWHGLHVAGTIAAGTQTHDTVGVAPGAQIVPIRVVGMKPTTPHDLAAAIRWGAGLAVDGIAANAHPADVLNVSIAEPGVCAAEVQEAIDAAVEAGTAIVVSAGNTWAGDPEPLSANYPGNCDQVIRVTATDYQGEPTAFTDHGTAEIPATISGPGAGITSTWNTGATTAIASPDGDTYAALAGTSMAAPHVAGVIALLRSVRPDLTVAQLTEALTATARPLSVDWSLDAYGAGIVDAPSALTFALGLPGAPSQSPSPSSASPTPESSPSPAVPSPVESPTPPDRSATPSPSAPDSVTTPSATSPTSAVPSTVQPSRPTPQPSVTTPVPTPRPSITLAKRPTLTGTFRVGRTVKASKGAWAPTPATVRYQWYRGTTKISKATKAMYKLTKKDRHKKVWVKITVTRSGYVSASATSKKRKVS